MGHIDMPMSLSAQHSTIKYSDESTLNTIDLCIPESSDHQSGSKKVWLLYIHGGAWRDPAIDANSFSAARSLLLKHSSIKHVQGIASINYRLSSYPSHKDDPSNPSDSARNAKHPDHINDILAAILYLQEQYGFEDRYLLVGHSCGATLALQVAMRRYWGQQYESSFANELNVIPPMTIVGVEGIFDLPELVDHYAVQPAYLNFITNAFGNDREIWRTVSPATADFQSSWSDGRLVYLLHQTSDELVDVGQPQLMYKNLLPQGWSGSDVGFRRVRLNVTSGSSHDGVWQDPTRLVEQLGCCIEETVALL